MTQYAPTENKIVLSQQKINTKIMIMLKSSLAGQERIRQSRWQRLNDLQKQVQKSNEILLPFKTISSVESLNPLPKLQQLILSILCLDKKLLKLVNLFPSQLSQLQLDLPSKRLRPSLKLLNTIIDSSLKQIKNEDLIPQWKQEAILVLSQCQKQWQMRWQIQQYVQIVNQKEKLAFVNKVKKTLERYGVIQKYVFYRGIVMRYMMDIQSGNL